MEIQHVFHRALECGEREGGFEKLPSSKFDAFDAARTRYDIFEKILSKETRALPLVECFPSGCGIWQYPNGFGFVPIK